MWKFVLILDDFILKFSFEFSFRIFKDKVVYYKDTLPQIICPSDFFPNYLLKFSKISFVQKFVTKILKIYFVLAGEIMSAAQEFLEDKMHPTKIIAAYRKALDDIEVFLNNYAKTIDPESEHDMKEMVNSALGTKFIRFL